MTKNQQDSEAMARQREIAGRLEPYRAADGVMSIAAPARDDVRFLLERIERLTAERDRYREAHHFLWNAGQRVCNQVTGGMEELHRVMDRYSGPEWAEWNPWDEGIAAEFIDLGKHHRECETAGEAMAQAIKAYQHKQGPTTAEMLAMVDAVEAWDAHQWPDLNQSNG